MTDDQFDTFIAQALKRDAPHADDAAVERVLRRLQTLPRQHGSVWRLPAVLLDWQFTPAWPRMAALAGCLALGFAIGISGLDRPIDRISGASASAEGSGLGAVVFEPEPLTGARP
ncbi:MAG TPA: hypothetical protein VFA57_15495 [Pseudolabrys sp.]|jgi:hypothetical protein|nr:hypothetical protein [Pseudolabrys sp.]